MTYNSVAWVVLYHGWSDSCESSFVLGTFTSRDAALNAAIVRAQQDGFDGHSHEWTLAVEGDDVVAPGYWIQLVKQLVRAE